MKARGVACPTLTRELSTFVQRRRRSSPIRFSCVTRQGSSRAPGAAAAEYGRVPHRAGIQGGATGRAAQSGRRRWMECSPSWAPIPVRFRAVPGYFTPEMEMMVESGLGPRSAGLHADAPGQGRWRRRAREGGGRLRRPDRDPLRTSANRERFRRWVADSSPAVKPVTGCPATKPCSACPVCNPLRKTRKTACAGMACRPLHCKPGAPFMEFSARGKRHRR
jgi:hypothetical protein